jgi:hypothetical protein
VLRHIARQIARTTRMTAVAVAVIGVALTTLNLAAMDTPAVGASQPNVVADSYWLVGADGGVFSFGDAGYHGSLGGDHLNAPIVGIAAGPADLGYWLVGGDGGVYAFGDARYDGSLGGDHLNAPIVGIAATPDGGGYWLVAADGGVFAFGDAGLYGSLASQHLNAPIVGIAATPDGGGYYLSGQDGGVFSFGSAPFFGSFLQGSQPLWSGTPQVVGISIFTGAPPVAAGYFVVATNGQTASFEEGPPQPNYSAGPSLSLSGPVVAFSAQLVVTAAGFVATTSPQENLPGVAAMPLNAPIVGIYSFLV